MAGLQLDVATRRAHISAKNDGYEGVETGSGDGRLEFGRLFFATPDTSTNIADQPAIANVSIIICSGSVWGQSRLLSVRRYLHRDCKAAFLICSKCTRGDTTMAALIGAGHSNEPRPAVYSHYHTLSMLVKVCTQFRRVRRFRVVNHVTHTLTLITLTVLM